MTNFNELYQQAKDYLYKFLSVVSSGSMLLIGCGQGQQNVVNQPALQQVQENILYNSSRDGRIRGHHVLLWEEPPERQGEPWTRHLYINYGSGNWVRINDQNGEGHVNMNDSITRGYRGVRTTYARDRVTRVHQGNVAVYEERGTSTDPITRAVLRMAKQELFIGDGIYHNYTNSMGKIVTRRVGRLESIIRR